MLSIEEVEEKTELYCRYETQSEEQDCFISLDIETGRVRAGYNPEIGNAVPARVYHGVIRRYPIQCLVADAANRLMEEIKPLLQIVLENSDTRWVVHSTIADLNEAAKKAEEEIFEICRDFGSENEVIASWDARDYLAYADLEIDENTSDDRLGALENEIISEAPDNIIIHGLEYFLREKREKAREKASCREMQL